MSELTIGRYEIRGELGEGGMGTVYRAYDPTLGREVALKALQPQLYLQDPQFSMRFEREARTIAALEHSSIVSLYEFGEDGEWLYLVMRLMEGGTLGERLEKGPLSLEEAIAIVRRVGGALDKAHRQGIVHRDVKPANILFDEDGEAFLSDFGIMKSEDAAGLKTRTGEVLGTPQYMSPEQLEGMELDGRTDIYSLGIILYEMLSGSRPYEANSTARIIVLQLTAPVPSIVAANPGLAPGLQAVINKAMAKEPGERYGTGAEMVEALKGVAAKQSADSAAVIVTAVVESIPEAEPPAKTSVEPSPTIAQMVPKPEAKPPTKVLEQPFLPVAEVQKKSGLPGWMWWVGAAVIVLLLVFGIRAMFGGGDDRTTEPAAESELAVESEPAADLQAMDEKSSIVISIPENPPNFNGYVGGGDYKRLIMELVMLGLTDIDPEGNIFPELAAELPSIENGGVEFDEEAWTMDVTWKLRDDIQWADGVPVTADDVIFTWDAMTDPETGTWFDGVDYTDSIEKVDDHTVVVHYNTVYPNFLVHFGGEDFVIWPAHYCDADQGFANWDCNREPLSNGPFLLEEWVTGDHLTFVRNPNYFEEGKPHIDEIFVQINPEEPVVQQLMLEGDVDFVMWPAVSAVETYAEVDNVDVSFAPSDRWVYRLHLNGAARGEVDSVEFPHPILSDVRVRQAMRMASDVDTISEEIFLGYSSPVWTETFRAPYQCDIPRPEYNPDAAAALLEEAGWIDEDGDGVRECHGCTTGAEEGYPMEMDFSLYAESSEEAELAQQLLAEMFKNIGIQTNLSLTEGNLLWAGYEEGGVEQNGNFDINMWDEGYPGIDPTDNLFWTYYSSAATEPDIGWNIYRWMNEDFDAWLGGAYTLDEEYRKEVFCEMAAILDEEVPQILLWSAFDAAAHSSRLDGVQATVNDVHTWNVADWSVNE